MKMVFRSLLPALLFIAASSYAQVKCPVDFDKITAADFELKNMDVDTSYGAVILADVGKSSFEANKKGFFNIQFKVNRRIKILNPKGFDLATVKISLYKDPSSDREELLESLKASTYNLVNGKVEETKLDKDNVFREVQDKKHVVKKFTMPAVKEGSIIDISYTIYSDFLFNLQPWNFQGSYPRLWSEYNLNLPSFFKYVFLTKGKLKFHVNESKEKFQSFIVRIPAQNAAFQSDDLVSLSSNNSVTRWVMKDVPALKEESFTSTMDNHLASIEFQMSGQQFPGMPLRDIMGSWTSVCMELLNDKEFGASFKLEEEWVKNALKTIGTDNKSELEKTQAIYSYIQKNMVSNGSRGIYTSQSPKETFTSKKGYVPDINLLLTLLLKKAGIEAFPVLLSTRSNGFANAEYPIMGQYNYVICKVEAKDKKSYFLDASKKSLGFNKIPSYCYNGYGAVIDYSFGSEPMFADTLTEKKNTSVMLFVDARSNDKWVGNLKTYAGYFESLNAREDMLENGQASYKKKIMDAYTGDFSAENLELKDVEDNEKVLSISYSLSVNKPDDNIIYFNPMIKEGLKENYFKSDDRKYPVELPYKFDEVYSLHLQIPEGYVVDELPKSERVHLNDTDGMFEYIISKSADALILRTFIKINKTIFMNDEYEDLKGFFDYIVKKHKEQIVFKKK